MKVLLVNHSDINGGAARAANRLLTALRQHDAIDDARMLVSIKESRCDWIDGPTSAVAIKLAKAKSRLSRWGNLLYRSDNQGTHSPLAVFSRLSESINASDADVVHLHWINNGTLSIPDIGRIKKPLVWTFHDMWPFCGAEHYTPSTRWAEGYLPCTRRADESGPDINRLTWLLKRRHWTQPIHVIAPSTWIAACVRQSPLMSHWPVEVVPNAIDLDRWCPMPQDEARRALGIPQDAKVVMFGALDNKDPRKGFDLLMAAQSQLAVTVPGTVMLTMGSPCTSNGRLGGLRQIALGHITNDEIMRQAYCAADVFVISSRQDNLPNTALESLACGTPLVAFNVGGLKDIVSNERLGELVEPFDASALAQAIGCRLAGNTHRGSHSSWSMHDHALKNWSHAVIADKHFNVYKSLLQSAHGKS